MRSEGSGEQEQADDGVPLTSAVSTAANAALGAALGALGSDVMLQVSWPVALSRLGLVDRGRVRRAPACRDWASMGWEGVDKSCRPKGDQVLVRRAGLRGLAWC